MELDNMTKDEFINLVSKVNETGEDEFKAEYNSPELIWENVISKIAKQKKVVIIGSTPTMLMAQCLADKVHESKDQTKRTLEIFNAIPFPIKNYLDDLPPITTFGSVETQKRNSRFTPKKKKRKK